MLSQYISNGKAHYNIYKKQLSLSYVNNLIIDKLQAKYQQILSLNLIHCNLSNLQGIQQFYNIQQLNIRYNNINKVDEILRITNKQKINRLQFIGNDIQYLGAALFINMIEHFPNLIQLNGKNYHSVLHKNTKNKYKMKNILAKVHKIQRQMQKTMRKQQKGFNMTKKNTQNYNQYLDSDCMITQNREKRSQKLSSLQKSDQQDQQRQSQRDLSQTSKKKYVKNNQSYLNYQNYIQNPKQNENIRQIDISLNDISNIPLTRSIRASNNKLTNSQIKQQKKKALQIDTFNQSLHNRQINLQPVTATFAMQRQKENISQGNNLIFKNKRKSYKNQQKNQIQNYNYQSKIQLYKDQYNSESQYQRNYSMCSQQLDQQNVMYDQIRNNENDKSKIVQAWCFKSLVSKIFNSWKILSYQGNLPMKRNHY